MNTPLVILRKRAEEYLTAFSASTGFDPDEVWEALVGSPDERPGPLLNKKADGLWEAFQTLRNAELAGLKEGLRP